METAVKKLYEAMFLVDSTQASDWDAVVKTIENVLKRSDAEIVVIRNWGERKLAYDIDHKTRGTYVLCFFKADGSSIPNIEKDVQLSEQILRVLILSTETREERDIEKDMFGTQDEKQTSVEDQDKDADISSPQDVDKDDDTASLQGPEADEAQQSAAPDVLDAIKPQQPPEPEPDDAIKPQQPPEPEPDDAIEQLPSETEEDAQEKDAAD
ncbi:MAG: 30S ribosomal protein S6 [Phycisphaerae bacterium]|nr:30S ribosomal protein S6 [Phycisphaerae bacterium]